MTVAAVDRMSHREYIGWQVYLGRKAQREQAEANKAKGGRR